MDSPALLVRRDEYASRLIEQALVLLRKGGYRMPSSFIEELFRRVPPEDLAGATAEGLLDSAAAAFAALEKRFDQEPHIALMQAAGDSGLSYLSIANDNMPFLVDSVMGGLAERGLDIRLVTHPILTVERRSDGALSAILTPEAQGQRESLIHIHISRLDDPEAIAGLIASLTQVLADVRKAVMDWPAMVERVSGCIADLKANPALPVTEIAEAIQFLEWLKANHFTFLGIRDYVYAGTDEAAVMTATMGTSLGVLTDPDVHVLRRGHDLVAMTSEMREFLRQPVPLIITKANVRSRVHRRVPMDYIGVKRFNDNAELIGETRIVGLFASAAYTEPVKAIPFLRRKYNHVMSHSGFDANSHSGKALANVLDHYPRDELYQLDEASLQQFAGLILQLVERPRVRVLARRDRFDRFVSVLVFVPRDRYDTRVQARIGDALAKVYKGRVSAIYPYLPEEKLARIHYIIGRYEGETPDVSRADLEECVSHLVRVWREGLGEELAVRAGHAGSRPLLARYGDAFPLAYREETGFKDACDDVALMDSLDARQGFALNFYRSTTHGETEAGLKIFAAGAPLPLSRRVPVLEAMGFEVVDERTSEIKPTDHPAGSSLWLHDMALRRADGQGFDLKALDEKLEAVLSAVMRGETESDGFNALVLEAGLNWRDVAILRALAHFMRQIRLPFGPDYLWATLRRYPQLAKGLVVLFHVRFDPRSSMTRDERKQREAEVLARLEEGLKQVSVLDEDRIIRQFMLLVQAALRTNFFQTDAQGQNRPVIAMKFASRTLDAIPEPRPLYEIFIDSPRVEGVHLRFGKIARGGIRWSDRPQDFRTEVLGLVKAQQVKNAVIVPVGAKGGFLPKFLPPANQREAWLAEGTASYQIFIRALLDLTDNIVDDKLVPPAQCIRYDEDDPYLVVAADKGTATFSDIANAISKERGHWLGDAFASGGSVGYDHKKMGITARGAFKAVARHFREMDIDIARQPFTVAGVGDMSGDVFGNGMLLSPVTKLVAAFDHRDIFIDPAPDPVRSFAERQRMFNLPRSSWQDYDRSVISAGGGVFSRNEKSIALSPEIRALLALDKASVTPQKLMVAILKAQVDLLWFGGIGTYIRASGENDADAGDRANDALRITGRDVRAKVIGEGANLGVTQKGRIEAAQNGVRLNSDAIDNSAGVNSSDVEVNLKIALSRPVREGKLNEADRSVLLASMTEDVARLVLRNNELQTLALSLAERRTAQELGLENRFMKALATQGRLDRRIEFLPDDAEIAARARSGKGLTRPELAVLLAYAKLTLFDDLIETKIPDDPYLRRDLVRYFPPAIEERFPDAISNHRLQREIIATMLGNSMINRGGPTFVFRLKDATGASLATIAAAFALARDCFGLTAFNDAVDRLDASIAGAVQLDLYAEIQTLLLDRTAWFISKG